MSLVSNFVGELSATMFGSNSKGITSNINIDNDTFDNLLQKQIQNNFNGTINLNNITQGLNIGDIDGYGINMNNVNSIESTSNLADKFNKIGEYTTSEVLTFFPSLFDEKPTLTQTVRNGLYDFERKMAANLYEKGARNIVTDVSEFVTDALKIF